MTEKSIAIDGQQFDLNVERDGTRFRAGEHEIELVAVRDNEAELRVGARTHFVPFIIEGAQISFAYDGEIWMAEVAGKGTRTRAKHRDHSMSAPMPGVVLKILVAVGDEVSKGTPLLILEAMKMEHQIASPRDGIVASINCKEGELVQPGLDLVTLA
jgi:3-methylcrotonyl-CoA carboxylase alpha subunit